MIFGSILVTDTGVETHRDSYLLAHLTVVSTRRPFFAGAVLCATGLTGFCLAFADLLYAHELILLVSLAAMLLIVGRSLGQLQLLSRDLRGTELSTAIFGTYRHLTRIRREITAAMQAPNGEGRK